MDIDDLITFFKFLMFVCALFLFSAMILFGLICAFAPIDKYFCKQSAAQMGYEYNYTALECFIKVDNKFIPLSKFRAFEK